MLIGKNTYKLEIYYETVKFSGTLKIQREHHRNPNKAIKTYIEVNQSNPTGGNTLTNCEEKVVAKVPIKIGTTLIY